MAKRSVGFFVRPGVGELDGTKGSKPVTTGVSVVILCSHRALGRGVSPVSVCCPCGHAAGEEGCGDGAKWVGPRLPARGV